MNAIFSNSHKNLTQTSLDIHSHVIIAVSDIALLPTSFVYEQSCTAFYIRGKAHHPSRCEWLLADPQPLKPLLYRAVLWNIQDIAWKSYSYCDAIFYMWGAEHVLHWTVNYKTIKQKAWCKKNYCPFGLCLMELKRMMKRDIFVTVPMNDPYFYIYGSLFSLSLCIRS